MATPVNLTPEASACFITGRVGTADEKSAARAAIGAGPVLVSADPAGWFGIRMAEGTLVTVGVFGDSTHWGYLAGGAQANPTPVATCQTMLRSYYRQTNPATQVVWVNNSVSGMGTSYGLSIWPGAMAALPAGSVVWIAYGTNDATGLVGSETKSVAAYAANLRKLIQAARDAGHTPVLETPLPLLPFGSLGTQDRAERLKNFVNSMRAVAAEMAVPLLDTYALFEQILKAGESPDLLFSDGIHLTQAGYDLRGGIMANFFMRGSVMPASGGILKSLDPPIRQYGGSNQVFGAPGSLTGWARIAQYLRIPVVILEPGRDLYLATPLWASGAASVTAKLNGVTVWTGNLVAAAMTGTVFAVDHEVQIGRNLRPGVYLIEFDAAAGDVGLYYLRTTPTREVPASALGALRVSRAVGDLSFTTGAGATGLNHALTDIPMSNALREVGIEFTANFGTGNQGVAIHSTRRSDGSPPFGGVLVYVINGTGYLTIGTGAVASYALTTLGSTDLRGVDHVYRIVARPNGNIAVYVDGSQVGSDYTPTIPYRGGQLALYAYDPGVTVSIRNLKIF